MVWRWGVAILGLVGLLVFSSYLGLFAGVTVVDDSCTQSEDTLSADCSILLENTADEPQTVEVTVTASERYRETTSTSADATAVVTIGSQSREEITLPLATDTVTQGYTVEVEELGAAG